MRTALTIAWVLGWAATATADEIPAAVLNRLRAATVLVNASGRYAESSGSGFVMGVRDGQTYIVTNAHATVLHGRPANAVSVVLHSGQPNEQVFQCEVVARDEELDLAVLSARIDAPPQPLVLPPAVEARETMAVYVVGYPFGRVLALGGGNPAVTIGRGTVSSLRRDRHGNLVAIQIDGGVNPGNSGGPVVNREGALLGICVAKVRDSAIGLAIPVDHLRAMLAGRVKSVEFREGEPADGTTSFEVMAQLIDPLRNLRQVSVLALQEDRLPAPKPRADGSWPPLPRAGSRPLKVDGDTAEATVQLVSLPDRRAGYWYQVRTVDAQNRTAYTEPAKVYVSPGRPAGAVVSRLPGAKPVDPGDDWLGQTPRVRSGPDESTPKPQAVARTLAGQKVELEGGVAVKLDLPGSDLLDEMAWSRDGKSFLIADRSGVLRRITTPSLMQSREVNLGTACGAMGVSSEGLVLLMPAREELWLVDAQRLEVLRRIPIRRITAVAAGPGSQYAVAAFTGHMDSDSLAVVDLKTGTITRQYRNFELGQQAGRTIRRHETSAHLQAIRLVALSADGKFVVVLSEGCLHRFALGAGHLEYEEVGPRIALTERGRIEICPDSRYVAMLCGAGMARLDDHPDVDRYGTYVYALSNLQLPLLSLQQGAYPVALAFDTKRRILVSQNATAHCLFYEPNGRLQKQWILPNAKPTRRHVLSSDNSQMLTLTGDSLYWIRLQN